MRVAAPSVEKHGLNTRRTRAATQPPHYGYIDALRGLAFFAVLVVHTHANVEGLPPLLDEVLGRGYAGVQLFFVVSALTLCMSLTSRSGHPAPLRAYLLRRAFRIVPMFWAAIILYMALYGFSDDPRWGIPDGLDRLHVVLAVFLLHGLSPHAINGVVPGGWTVATEIEFYCLLPLLLMWCTSLRRTLWLCFIAGLFSAAALPGLEYAMAPFYPPEHRFILHAYAYYALSNQLPVFIAGIVLFRLLGSDRPVLERIERYLPARPRTRAALILLVTLMVGLPVDLAASPLRLATTFPGHLGYAVLAVLFTYALATYPLGALVNPVTRFLGRISYSGYLLHLAIIQKLNLVVAPLLADQPVIHLMVLGSGTLVLTVAASALTHAWIEQPGIELGRRLIAVLATRSEAVPNGPLQPA